MIRGLSSGRYRLYSRKKDPKTGTRRNLGPFKSRAAAEKHLPFDRRVILSVVPRGEIQLALPGSEPVSVS